VAQSAKQSYSKVVSSSETSAAHSGMNDSCYKELSTDNWSEYVPQQDCAVSTSPSASKTRSWPQQMLRNANSGKLYSTPSETYSLLKQPCVDDAHDCRPLACQANGDTQTTISDVSHPKNTHSLQSRQVHASTDEKPQTVSHRLLASDVVGDDTRLTVEDIYIEAMTLDAVIRINRRRLDDRSKAQLSRIMEFCRDALREKLLLSSVAKRANGRNRQQK